MEDFEKKNIEEIFFEVLQYVKQEKKKEIIILRGSTGTYEFFFLFFVLWFYSE